MTKRKTSVHGKGADAITPELTKPAQKYNCSRCTYKEEFITRLSSQIERLQKVVRDQQQEIGKKQQFFDKIKTVLAEQAMTLKPAPTTRPAQKGAGL